MDSGFSGPIHQRKTGTTGQRYKIIRVSKHRHVLNYLPQGIEPTRCHPTFDEDGGRNE